MTSNRRDVQLVISAKNEGQRVVQGAAADLKSLLEIAGQLANGVKPSREQLVELGRAISGVEKAAAPLDGAVRKGEEAFKRQEKTLRETRDALDAVKKQIGEVARAQEATRVKIVDAVLSGQDATALRERLEATKAALTGLVREQERLKGSAAAQEAAIGQSRSSLQQLGSAANAVDSALKGLGESAQREMLKAAAAAETARDKFREAAAAAKAEMRGDQFSRFMGVTEDPRGKQAGKSASVFQAQDRVGEEVVRRFREFAAAQEEAARAGEQVRAKLEPLIALEQRLNQELALAEKAWRAGALSTQDYFREIERLSSELRKAQLGSEEWRRIQEAAAKATRQAADEDRRLAAEADSLRSRMDPLAAIQERLNQSLARLPVLMAAGKISASELAKAEELLRREADEAAKALERLGRGSQGKPGFLGVKPHEMQNLGYQVNDIFTQLASGTSVTQTLAQQGGQLLQLFPKVGHAMLAAFKNPIVLAAAAGFVVVAAGISAIIAKAARLREIEAAIARVGSASNLSSQDVLQLSSDLRDVGLSSDEAATALSSFITAGVNPAKLGEMAELVRNMSDALGIDLKEATKLAEDGLLGDAEAFRRLQEQTRTYIDDAQMRLIEKLYEEGRAGEARAIQMREYAKIMDESAEKAVGPWTKMFRSVRDGVVDFTESVGNSILKVMELGQVLAALQRGDLSKFNVDIGASIVEGAQGIWKQGGGAVPGAPGAQQPGAVGGAVLGSDDPRSPDARPRQAQLRELERIAKGDLEIIRLSQQLNETRDAGARIRIAGEIEYRREFLRTSDAQRSEAKRMVGEERERQAIRERGRRDAEQKEEQARRRAEQQAERDRENEVIQYATPFQGGVTSGFGPRRAPVDPRTGRRGRSYHPGVDYGSPMGSPVVAPAPGVVTEVDPNHPGFGKTIVIDHGRGMTSRLSHLSEILVELNQTVGKQELVARSGDSGVATGPHGHWELHQNGTPVDPRLNGQRWPTGIAEAVGEALEDEEERLAKQREFDDALSDELHARQKVLSLLREARNLSGDDLFNKQRAAKIEEGMAQFWQRAEQAGVQPTEGQAKSFAQLLADEFDVENYGKHLKEQVGAFQSLRQELLQTVELGIADGVDASTLARMNTVLDWSETKLRAAGEEVIKFFSQFSSPEARLAIQNVDNLLSDMLRAKEDRDRANIERPLEQQRALRDALAEQRDHLRDIGDTAGAEALHKQLKAIDVELISLIERLIAFWSASTRPEAAATVAALTNLRNQIAAAGQDLAITARDIQEAFADAFVNRTTEWADALGEGRDALQSTLDLAVGFATDFVRRMAEIVLQAQAMKLAMKLGFADVAGGINGLMGGGQSAAELTAAGGSLTFAGGVLAAAAVPLQAAAASFMAAAAALAAAGAGGGGGSGGLIGNFLDMIGDIGTSVGPGGAGLFHEGGIAGRATKRRKVFSTAFNNVVRYHGGGIAGLQPGEVPAILKRGEEILTENDPRHIFNGGGGGDQRPQDIKIINAIDGGEVVSKGLNTRAGERAVLNVIRSNAGAVKQAIGG